MKIDYGPATPVSVKLLSSGYWHVRFGGGMFVQWPRGREATAEDAFIMEEESPRLAESLAAKANRCVEALR